MNKIRVLLADSHLLFREGLRRLLDGEVDIECVAIAEDGEQVTSLAKELVPGCGFN